MAVHERSGLDVTTASQRLERALGEATSGPVAAGRNVARPRGASRLRVWRNIILGRVPDLDNIVWLSSMHPIAYSPVPRTGLYALSDADLIWQLFSEYHDDIKKGPALRSTKSLLGAGLLTSEPPAHRVNRRTIQPTFSPRQVAAYADQMVAATRRLDREWERRVAMSKTDVLIVEQMSEVTLDIVGRTVFSADLVAETRDVGRAFTDVIGRFGSGVNPLFIAVGRYLPFTRRRFLAATERLDAIVERLILDRKAELASGVERDDALTRLLLAQDPQTGDRLPDQELRDEVMTLVLAGHETTAMLLSWTWLELSRDPDVLAWVRAEWDGMDSEVDADSLRSMPRTQALIHESLRMHPPAWALERQATRDLDLAGYTVPDGSILIASQYAMHRDPRYWADPGSFIPQRWLDDAGSFNEKQPGQPRGAWFPFGFGARRCIGDRFALMEAGIVLATLGRKWDVVIPDPNEVKPKAVVTLRPENGIPARIRRRD